MKNQKRSLAIKIHSIITSLLPSTFGRSTVSTKSRKIYVGVAVSYLCFKEPAPLVKNIF